MKVGSVCRLAATRLLSSSLAIKKFFGPLDPADPASSTSSRTRTVAPFCVSYGRAVFCMHYPVPQLLPQADDDRSSDPISSALPRSPD
jgi:hypothetical protein